MSFRLQGDGSESDATSEVETGTPSFRDNAWLDEYEFHFGEWVKQIVDWTDINLGWLLDAFIWPFEFLFELIMNEDEGATSIMSLPWYWVAIVFFLIGAVVRTTRVGIMAATLVAACGLLGPDYWSETTKTFGMIFVSVLLCAVIGIPLGVLCGRVDSVWNSVRPVLDAMQVVHPFVYMLPFIFFWGTGEPAATMATLVFALPPLVRLTNLGVRQVPSDVVEASRAFGANEFRVLTDVQLPLARPAVLTGLNQTLLMAISMLGIAAIMGAGGLGKLLLQAISSNNLAQATSGGLAYFFVAVVLDRISQRESTDDLGLFGRIREAWSLRRDPEAALAAAENRRSLRAKADGVEAAGAAAVDDSADADVVTEAEEILASIDERDAPIEPRERLGLLIGLGGMALATVSVFLTWGTDAGLVSAWGRRNDETGLLGRSFSGIEASGGSMFAVFLLGFSLIGLTCAIRPLVSFANGDRQRSLLNRGQGIGITLLSGVGLAVWLFNIFDGDVGGWLDGSSGGYNRFWTVAILLAGFALGEYLGGRLTGRHGAFAAGFVLSALFAVFIGDDRLTNLGLIVFALVALSMMVETFIRGTAHMGADGLAIMSLAGLGVTIGYFVTNDAPGVVQYSHGLGVYLALIGTIVASVGGLIALFAAPYVTRVPHKLNVKWPIIIAACVTFLAIWVAMIAPWSSDGRLDTLMTPELEAEIERLREEAGDDINKQIANGQAITNLINSTQADPSLHDGLQGDGPRLGWATMGFAGAALASTLVTAGLMRGGERQRWHFGALTAGLGLAALAIPAAWIFSFTRTAEPRAVSGNGSFFAMAFAFILFAIGRSAIADFHRRRIYSDPVLSLHDDDSLDHADVTPADGVLVGGGGD